MIMMRVVIGAISAAVSLVVTQPVVNDIVRRYFSSGVSDTLYIVITIIAFAVVGYCLYLFLQDLYGILCPPKKKGAAV